MRSEGKSKPEAIIPKFFVATDKGEMNDADAEQGYQAMKVYISHTEKMPINDRRIYKIDYDVMGVYEDRVLATVGRRLRSEFHPDTIPETVAVIFEAQHEIAYNGKPIYLICTLHQGFMGGRPVTVTGVQNPIVTDFDE